MEDPQAVTYLGEANFRNKNTKFGIKALDRTKHMYIIGKSGTGKSTFLENMAIQDIQRGSGIAFIDPHGGSAEKLLEYVPPFRQDDVIYFAPFDTDYPISFNVMEDVGPDKRHLVANGLMSAFKKIWVDAWSARMEYILTNTLLALLEYPGSTLLGVNRMYGDKEFRKRVVDNVKDSSVKSFWVNEFAKYDERNMREYVSAIQNKIGQFTANPLIRNLIGQPKSTFDFRRAMDEKKIIIINLSKGRLGDQNASLLGAMLITKVYLAAMSRADVAPHEMGKLPALYFYADEFQNFANDSFADILSEARKYKLCLTIAHQYVEQLPENLRAAVLGNVGSMVVFRVGAQDAELFEKEFAPVFVQDDFTNLAFRQLYLRISIDGVGSKPFSAKSLEMIPNTKEGVEARDLIIAKSRAHYARPRAEVEAEIESWFGFGAGKSGDYDARMGGGQGGDKVSTGPRVFQAVYKPKEAPTESAKPKFQAAYNPTGASVKPAQQVPPVDREVRGWKKGEESIAPKSEPLPEEPLPTASDELQGLLSQLDEPKKEEIRTKQQEPNKEQKSVTPIISKPTSPVSIPRSSASSPRESATFKYTAPVGKNDRSASDEKKNSLKSALAKAMEMAKQSTPTPSSVDTNPLRGGDEVKGEGQSFIKLSSLAPSTDDFEDDAPVSTSSPLGESQNTPTQREEKKENSTNLSFASRTPKEVPEDVLRRVLE